MGNATGAAETLLAALTWGNLLSGALGALIVGIGVWFLSRRDAQKTRTFEFHRDFTSDGMWESRSRADDLLFRHRGTRLRELYSREAAKNNVTAASDLWRVIGFYERLSIAFKHNEINRNLAAPLFAETYLYWYHHLCPHIAKEEEENWQSVRNMAELRTHLRIALPYGVFRNYDEAAKAEIEKVNAERESVTTLAPPARQIKPRQRARPASKAQ